MSRATITRRDFLNGVAFGTGGTIAGGLLPDFMMTALAGGPALQDAAEYYPPTRTGLRGNHPGSFEGAHRLRDGDFWSQAGKIADTDEAYDLVVVGGGISGLAAAYFYRARHADARILILDNHDDFGGHAKRNEFELGGRLVLINGGTMGIDSPRPYSVVADGLLKALGVDPVALAKKCADRAFYPSLGLKRGLFFDRETFGADKLVVVTGKLSWPQLLAQTRLSPQAQSDIARIEEADIDYLSGLSSAAKKSRLSKMSYRDFLLNVANADPDAVAFYQARTHGEWGVGIDAVSALDVWAFGFPGFQGLHLAPGSAPHMGFTAAGYADGGSYTFHFPDGNASIARLLVRHLVPGSVPGDSAEDVVTARVDYSRLDHADASVHIRLNSIVARVRNVGDPLNRSRRPISARRQCIRRARAIVRARLLQHDDSVSLPGTAGPSEGCAALCRQNSAHLCERGAEELEAIQDPRYRPGLFARLVFFLALPQPDGRYRGVSQPSLAGRTDAATNGANAGSTGFAGARAASRRTF